MPKRKKEKIRNGPEEVFRGKRKCNQKEAMPCHAMQCKCHAMPPMSK
jgi:hypothetical protein